MAQEPEHSPAGGMGNVAGAIAPELGTRPRRFQKLERGNNEIANRSIGKSVPTPSPSVNLVVHDQGRLGQPIKTEIEVGGTPMLAVMDSGATISAGAPLHLIGVWHLRGHGETMGL